MGRVSIVGAGPGDPDLITWRGFKLLMSAEVVVYDRLVDPRLYTSVPPNCRLVSARRGRYGYGDDQARINRLLAKEAKAGHHVVRLKGGDPFIFGRGSEELEHLQKHRIPVEVVPGITAAVGSGVPLTDRRWTSSVTFITGHDAPDLPEVPKDGSIVVYMGIRTLPIIAKTLIDRGWKPSTPACVVASATLPTQQIVKGTLKTLPALSKKIRPPALVVVGNVVRSRIGPSKKLPLAARSIVVTRPYHQGWELMDRLSRLGASVLSSPSIQIIAPGSWKKADEAISNLHRYDVLAFTSINAVDRFIERLDDIRQLSGLQIFAVGPGTAEALEWLHIKPDGIPMTATVDELARFMKDRIPPDAKVLHPCGNLANPILRKKFDCDEVEVYRTVPAELRLPKKELESASLLTFASSETVRQFAKAAGKGVRKIPAVCIGPVTAKTARELGFRVAATAKPHTIDGLVKAVRKALRR